jgi:S1-C subfamily serine protease
MGWLYTVSAFLVSTLSITAQNSQDSIARKQDQSEKRHEIEQQIYPVIIEQEQFTKRYHEILKKQIEISLQKANMNIQGDIIQEIVHDKDVSIHESPSESPLNAYIKHKKKHPRLTGPSQYDSRIEPIHLDLEVDWQNEIFTISESVGMLLEIERIHQVSKSIYQLDISQTLGQKLNLCEDEAFYNQPSVGVGTSFIIDEKSMLTALHVLERSLKFYVVVFNYKIITKNGVVNAFVAQDDIYYPQHIVTKNEELDIVEFSVDRNFNRPVLQWENSDNIKKEISELYTIGYPSGIPMKIALNASIIEDDHPFYYYTSLDSFQGNSGSPVFNFYTNKVIGVLVSGELDYKFNGNCNLSSICKYPYCKGEKVIRIEEILKTW